MNPRIIHRTDDLIDAVRKARESKGLSHSEVDEGVGLTDGHMSKIEGFDRAWGKSPFWMTPTMDWLLLFLGLRLVVVPAAMAEELTQCQSDHTHREITLLEREGSRPVKMARATSTIVRRPNLNLPRR